MVLSVRVRRSNDADIPALIDLAGQSPNAAQWSQSQYEDLFSTPHTKSSERLILLLEAASESRYEPAAFLVAHRVGEDWELENIAVSQSLHRRGLGARMVKEFIDYARNGGGHAIFLEVRASNQVARALYRKAGFQEWGERPGYYHDPTEPAIQYRLMLS